MINDTSRGIPAIVAIIKRHMERRGQLDIERAASVQNVVMWLPLHYNGNSDAKIVGIDVPD